MNLNPITPLKWGAVVLAVFWTGAMLWWTGSIGPVEIFILAFCGALAGYGWYYAMRFVFRCVGLLTPVGDEAGRARRGKLRPWIVWAGAMAVTLILTVWLLDLVDPFIPAGDSQPLIQQLFVVLVWPALMWSMRPMIRRSLPRTTICN